MAGPFGSYAFLGFALWCLLVTSCTGALTTVTFKTTTYTTTCATSSTLKPTTDSGTTTDSIIGDSASATSVPSAPRTNGSSSLDPYAIDWSAPINDEPIPSASPEPSPHPLTDPAVARLVRTTQDAMLKFYDAYATFSCAAAGSSLNCKGPWVYADSWNNDTIKRRLYQNTAVDSSYYCSYDSTYLQPSSKNRNFYGFSKKNITSSLQNLASYASLWAAGACASNQTCAKTYKNDTSQMSSDFREYLNNGFFAGLNKALANESYSYCPAAISGSASLFEYATSHFDFSREYYGLHNALFLPGVGPLINGTVEEARLELGLSLANNARRVEGTLLNMIFYTPTTSLKVAKRSGDEEVYPGCTRREYVMEGHCEGVIPPREFDLAGDFMAMKDRDMMEVWGQFSHPLENTGLIRRDAACDAKKSSIESHIKDLAIARDVFNTALDVVAVAQVFLWGAALGATPWAVAVYGLAVAEFLVLATIAECEPFHTCDGVPPAAIDTAKAIGKFQAGVAAKLIAERTGVKNLVGLLKSVVTTRNLAPGKLFSGVTGAIVGLGGTLVDKFLSNAQKYFESALDCCGDTCDSAACQQASLRCALAWGNQWSGAGKLNCGAI